jgi:hypothetical protein
MPGLVPGIRVVDVTTKGKTWMAGTSPAMTVRVGRWSMWQTKAEKNHSFTID